MEIVEKAKLLRKTIESLSTNLDDTEALDNIELFPLWSGEGIQYGIGDRRRYGDELYRCLLSHTSQPQWTPVSAPSLWTLVLIPDPEVIPEWIQPDSTNPYMTGDKVTHNGKTWICTIDNNVWEPGVYGWEVVE